jgi:hypothetical protein
MIASILFNATADDVRFILIDPKMLELSVYENIPHLLVPVVVDPEKAAAALLWGTQEMETRYRMMRDMGVRNIDGYNRALGAAGKVVELKPVNLIEEGAGRASAEDGEPIKHRRLPKIVIVIDELADLLLSEGKTVERDITRLAQKARASGIHLILATQRPSVDVLTGLIKANLPSTRAPSSIRSALSGCSGRATCCSCRRAARSCAGYTARSSPRPRFAGSSIFFVRRVLRTTRWKSWRPRYRRRTASTVAASKLTTSTTRRCESCSRPIRRRSR